MYEDYVYRFFLRLVIDLKQIVSIALLFRTQLDKNVFEHWHLDVRLFVFSFSQFFFDVFRLSVK